MGIAGNLLSGRSPACRCFGQLQAKPIGADTLVRNAALLALAAAVVGAGPSRSSLGLLHALSALTGASALAVAVTLGAAVIIATQAVLQWNLILQHGRLLRRIDHLERHTGAGGVAAVQPHGASMKQLAVGAIAPEFELEASEGGALSLATLRSSGLPVLLVFTEAGCPACRDFMPRLREWEDRLAGIVRIAVITAAAPDRAHVAGVRTALFQRGREISDAYGVSAIPAGLTVRADGTVSSTVMLGGDAIATLLPAPPAAEKGGAAIPIIEALA
jgi:peroxiredoxin